jgi:hypothetical protein
MSSERPLIPGPRSANMARVSSSARPRGVGLQNRERAHTELEEAQASVHLKRLSHGIPTVSVVVGAIAAILTGISIASGYWVVPVAVGLAAFLMWLGLRYPLSSTKLLLLLSALYFPIKLTLPSPLNSVWLDIVLVTILVGWLLRVVMRPTGSVGSRTVAVLLGLFLAWGAIEVLRAPSLLHGVFGFRTVFASFLAFGLFSAASVTPGDRAALLKTILGIGCAIAAYCVGEFVLINAHLMSPGSWIDVGRGIYMRANQGYPPAPRFGLTRSLGPWPDPSQAALYMIGALGLGLRGFWLKAGRRGGRLAILLLCLGVFSTLSTWPMVVAVLLIAAAIILRRPSRVPERIVWVTVCGVAVFVLLFVSFRVPIPIGPEVGVVGYSGTTLHASTSNLRQAFAEGDLAGTGLYNQPSPLSNPAGGVEFANLGFRYLFLDDLVTQLGLIGICLLLGLWTAGIVKGYWGATRAGSDIDRDQLAVALALAGLLLASQHYGAPLIYGVNYLLVALLAMVSVRAGSLSHVRAERLARRSRPLRA